MSFWCKSLEILNPYEAICGKDSHVLTNADRIRAMPDEELAKLIFDWFSMNECKDAFNCKERVPGKCNGRCRLNIADWFKQPWEGKL